MKNVSDLRKCKTDWAGGDLFYFHGWVQLGRKEIHPEDPRGDLCYAKTFGLIENIELGTVTHTCPEDITFID